MNKKKTQDVKPAKRKYVKKAAALSIDHTSVQPFEIELAPPNYRLNPDLANTLKRVEQTMKIILPGQAFVAPSKSKNTVKRFMEENWPLYQFMYSAIKDNPSMMRVYFLRRLDKK